MIKSISIFFPVYNDENTIDEIVNKTVAVVKHMDYEIILVNDGSQDGTQNKAEALARKNKRIKIISHSKNRGYGGALKSGFAAAKKNWIFYTDGDAQYNVLEMKKLLQYKNYDLVQGYKIRRRDGILRNVFGSVYATLAKTLYGVKIKDPTCDFRLIKRECIKKINLKSNSGFICIELIKKLERQKIKIKEVPVTHLPRRYGSSQAFKIGSVIFQIRELLENRGKI